MEEKLDLVLQENKAIQLQNEQLQTTLEGINEGVQQLLGDVPAIKATVEDHTERLERIETQIPAVRGLRDDLRTHEAKPHLAG